MTVQLRSRQGVNGKQLTDKGVHAGLLALVAMRKQIKQLAEGDEIAHVTRNCKLRLRVNKRSARNQVGELTRSGSLTRNLFGTP